MLPTTPNDNAAVLIVSYNARPLLADCLASLLASPDAPPPAQIVIVDNASADDTVQYLCQHHPQLTLIQSPQNVGFAGGNNLGFAHIRQTFPQVKYVALLNQDILVAEGWLGELVNLLDQRPAAASTQSKLRLHPETHLLNSAGNCSQYLGFGFTTGYREPDVGQYDQVRPLAFCSGAAMLVRISDVTRETLFDPWYFCYLEDAELGWYFRIQGKENLFCPTSVVYHRYQFSRNAGFYYRLERNRWRLILTYYRVGSILLLLPMLALMELGLLFYFLRAKALREKLQSWDVFCQGNLRQSRRQIQRIRRISDQALTALFTAKVTFSEIRNPLLDHLGNPILIAYRSLWRSAGKLLR